MDFEDRRTFPTWQQYKSALHEVLQGVDKSAPGRFNPYSDEGGTTAAIAGDSFVVIGSDTRMQANSSAILTRNCNNDKVYFSSAGFYGDILQVVKVLESRFKIYKFNFNEEISADAASQLLSRQLYYRRFFPYYVSSFIAGITSTGKGAIFGYDPVGCIEQLPFTAQGSCVELMDPMFDNLVGSNNLPKGSLPPLTLERALVLMKDAFRAAAERETGTGDQLRLIILQAGQSPIEQIVRLRGD